MTITTTRFSGLGLALAGMVAAAALSAPPALAQGLAVTAPTHPTWARWLGIDSGQSFVLKGQAQAIEIGRSQSPVRVRVCVNAGTTPMSDNVDAKVMTDQGETIVPVGHCRVIEGTEFTVAPARALGGKQRVKGLYNVVG